MSWFKYAQGNMMSKFNTDSKNIKQERTMFQRAGNIKTNFAIR